MEKFDQENTIVNNQPNKNGRASLAIVIVNIVWLVLGLIALIVGLSLGNLGSSSTYVYNPEEYINGDAYNYIIEASIMAGQMSMFIGSVVSNTIIGAAGVLVMFVSSCGLVKELSKRKKKIEIKQDNGGIYENKESLLLYNDNANNNEKTTDATNDKK